MSIATEITRLQNAKASIKTSIENKGVTVPPATKLDGYSTLIDSIQSGGIDLSAIKQSTSLQNIGGLFNSFENGNWDSLEYTCVSGTNPIQIDFGREIKGFICYPKSLTSPVGNTANNFVLQMWGSSDENGQQTISWFASDRIANQNNGISRVGSVTLVNNVLSLTPDFPSNASYHPFRFGYPYLFVYWW